MKKNCLLLIVMTIMLFSGICSVASAQQLKVVIGDFNDVANKSIWTGAKEGIENTDLGTLNSSSAASYVTKELTGSGYFIIPGRRTKNESGADLYVSGDITNCAVKVSNLGYENSKVEGALENRKYTINIDLVLFFEEYESETMLFGVNGHGESSCTGTDVKYAEHTVKVGAERVTDDSITKGMEKACKVAVQKAIQTLKKQGRIK